MALAIRINSITKGSTKAVMVSSPSSNQASTYREKEKGNLGSIIIHTGFCVLVQAVVQVQVLNLKTGTGVISQKGHGDM